MDKKVVDNFSIEELVCSHVFKVWGNIAWNWMDPRLREFLIWFRSTIGKPIYVNWPEKGLTQRGLRCNICQLVKDKTLENKSYNSAHIRFQAIDFNVEGMTDSEVRQWLSDHKEFIPVPIRIENNTEGWTHIDVCNSGKSNVEYFNA